MVQRVESDLLLVGRSHLRPEERWVRMPSVDFAQRFPVSSVKSRVGDTLAPAIDQMLLSTGRRMIQRAVRPGPRAS